jgi:glycosyltransferase involved in cell wall biosynthesis
MSPRPERPSVVVTTYNWPGALRLALSALSRQVVLPHEVIVADDGSTDETHALIRQLARNYPVPLRHSWIEDRGFRAALARNRAIAAASGDYVLLLDGDMVAHPMFVADHRQAARRGSFVQGIRVLAGPLGSERLLASEKQALGFFDRGLARRRHTLRIPPLAALALRISRGRSRRGIKTCNQAWWRSDLVAVNGFDERFEGWGREDSDLALRAFHAGLQRRSLRFAGLATHLHHLERHQAGASRNEALLAETLETGRVRSVVGLDRHVAEFAARPLPDLRSPGNG